MKHFPFDLSEKAKVGLTSLQHDISIHIKICPISQARPPYFRPPYFPIVDESVSCQSTYRPRHQTVVAPIDFAGRGPPVVKPLLTRFSHPLQRRSPWCARTPSGQPKHIVFDGGKLLKRFIYTIFRTELIGWVPDSGGNGWNFW